MNLSDRRGFLRTLGTGALGCSLAASPLITPVTFASAPWDARLVVIVLRGAMDGLDVVQPLGDAALTGHRKTLLTGEAARALDLDGFYAMHPALTGLAPLWTSGELAFAHAVSTPYRDKRSHFDGQDLLENGGPSTDGNLTQGRDGWLNRLLTLVPGAEAETAFAVGRENLLLLRGSADVSSWSPDSDLEMSHQGQLLLESLYANDPLFREAADQAFLLSAETDAPQMRARAAGRAKALAAFSATRLLEETRIAAFSIGGWDTHRNQAGALKRALSELQTAVLVLKRDLGPVWQKTAVLAVTEFGRTVRENGNRGTDHGTAGAMLMAGGALSGARVHGKWPGLGEGDLYRDRDLMPTDDLRRYAGWALRELFGIPKSDIERTVFPGASLGQRLKLMA